MSRPVGILITVSLVTLFLSTGRPAEVDPITLCGHTDTIQTVTFSPDGALLASASRDETIKLWEVKTGRNLATLTGHDNIVRSVAFSHSGYVLASGSTDK